MGKIADAIGQLNIEISQRQEQQLQQYMDGILQWNEKINLTAIKDRDEFIVKHYVDSIVCTPLSEYKEAKTIIDVGTGAGFPGVPLAIMSPQKEFLLLDSLNKRLKIVDELCMETGVCNVKTVHSRAEDLAAKKDYRESFDLCVSRAVANLAVLAEYCLPFVKVGGYLLAYKGADAEAETTAAKKAISLLGGEVVRMEKINSNPSFDEHHIIVIKKKKTTPAKYPRKAGIPTKEPIK